MLPWPCVACDPMFLVVQPNVATGVACDPRFSSCYIWGCPLGSPAVQRRPLPPVPGGNASTNVLSPVEVKKRPLPATPGSNSGVHINAVGHQTSPLVQKRLVPPPPKPAPYRKPKSGPSPPPRRNKSEPSPPPAPGPPMQPPRRFGRSASLSPPPSLLLAEEYEELATQSQPEPCDYECGVELNAVEDNYSLATSGELCAASGEVCAASGEVRAASGEVQW